MLLLLLSSALAAEGTDDVTALPPAPERNDPASGDMDAAGYPDKVTFYKGQPVLIIQTGDSPEVRPLDIQANGILVAPSYLAYLEKTAAWAEGLEDFWRLDVSQCEDTLARTEWMLEQTQAALVEAQKPTPFLQRPGTWIGGGVLAGVGLTIAAAYSLDLVEELN